METVNIREAKKRLSQLVEQAAGGETIIISKDGKPLVRVVAIESPQSDQVRRTGFLTGQFRIPDDFDRMAEDKISDHFVD